MREGVPVWETGEQGGSLVGVCEGQTGSCKDVSRQRTVSTKGWRCCHVCGAAQGGGSSATALEGAAKEQTAIQTRPRGSGL